MDGGGGGGGGGDGRWRDGVAMGDGDGGGTIAMGNGGGAMDGGTACDGRRRNVRRDGSANGSAIAMDGGSNKTLLNLECAMAWGLPQFLVRKGRSCA